MINVYSEIGQLKAVLLHEPGEEINNLTPKYLDELLFDDIPWLPLAIKEHRSFAKVFSDNGVKVYYLVDLISEVLDKSDEIKKEFINRFILDANIKSQTLGEMLFEYLYKIEDNKKLVLKCISGIKKNELDGYKNKTLSDFINTTAAFITNPIPNLYFTRDPFASLGNGACVNRMYSDTRRRETIFADFIFHYHDKFQNTPHYYDRFDDFDIEGGDILVLNKETILIGVSQRTSSQAIELLAKRLFFKEKTTFKTILALSIPIERTFMHLDTVLTQVDYDKFLIHEGCYNSLNIYKITEDSDNYGKLLVVPLQDKLDDVLKDYIGVKPKLIFCGGNDSITSDREQWSDGSNCLCIKPGVVIAYERNENTNERLRQSGVKVITIPSSEISRGRGGPRCMSMPLIREDI